MKIIYNKIIPFKGFKAINLFGVVFARKALNDVDVQHEMIHTLQMRELGYIFFYLIYLMEWFVRLFMRGNAYRNVSFEREAYRNQYSSLYIANRRHFAQWRK